MMNYTLSEERLSDEVNRWFWAGFDADKKEQKAPLYRRNPIQVYAHDKEGNRIGGLVGIMFWDWLYIDMLWIEKKNRKRKVGTELMKRAEQEAQNRNCVGIYLWTESFQSPGFYEKLGYERFVVLPDFPRGHQRIGFMKRIAE